jgi:histidine triad (HIT) family protein
MTVFAKIIAGEIPADIVYENEFCIAFRDLVPQAPTHILVIPRKPIERLSAVEPADAQLLGQLLIAAKRVIALEGLSDARIVINDGPGAGQTVFHLHLHVLGGRLFDWPPG